MFYTQCRPRLGLVPHYAEWFCADFSHAKYPRPHAVQETVHRLRDMTAENVHQFWPDDVCLLDDHVVDSSRIHGPRQLSDVYLNALAVAHHGALVTFDKSIGLGAVRNAMAANVAVL